MLNLQVPDEHGSCSLAPLHSSGFSYDPNMLMENGSESNKTLLLFFNNVHYTRLMHTIKPVYIGGLV